MRLLAAIFLAGIGTAFAANEGTAPKGDTIYRSVGFDELAGFPFVAPPVQPPATAPAELPDVMQAVPESVKKLDGKKVELAGFMLPIKMERGLATEFLLLNTPLMCCFGITPPPNAWVIVKMPKGVKALQDVPVAFRGQLRVRAQWDNGYLAGIYQLDGEAVVKSGN